MICRKLSLIYVDVLFSDLITFLQVKMARYSMEPENATKCKYNISILCINILAIIVCNVSLFFNSKKSYTCVLLVLLRLAGILNVETFLIFDLFIILILIVGYMGEGGASCMRSSYGSDQSQSITVIFFFCDSYP